MISSGSLVKINTKISKNVTKKRFAATDKNAPVRTNPIKKGVLVNHGDIVLLLENGFTYGAHNDNPARRTKVLYRNKIVYVILKYSDEIL